PLVQHRRHVLEPERGMDVTHLRVHIFPHGGGNRLRVHGRALDTPSGARMIAALNAMVDDEARALLLSFKGARAFADPMLEGRPYSAARALFDAADAVWWALGEKDWLEAFAAHPRLGQSTAAPTQTDRSASWSKGEQAGISTMGAGVSERMAALNE